MTPFMYFMIMWIENNDVTERDIRVLDDMVADAKKTYLLWEQILGKAKITVSRNKDKNE